MRYAVDPKPGSDFYRWRLVAINGRTVAVSKEWFYSQGSARTAAMRFKSRCRTWNYEVYGDLKGIYRWRAKSSENQIIALCNGTFSSQFSARNAASDVRDNGGTADGP